MFNYWSPYHLFSSSSKRYAYSFLHLKYKSSKYKHSLSLFQKHFCVNHLNLNESGLIAFLKPKNGHHPSSSLSVFVLQPAMQLKETITAETPGRVFVPAQIQRVIAGQSFKRKSQTSLNSLRDNFGRINLVSQINYCGTDQRKQRKN